MFAPLLQKVRIALGLVHDQVCRLIEDLGPLMPGRSDDCLFSIGRAQGPDLGKVEEPFGVGFGVAHPPTQLRQACADHGDRQLFLAAAVKR